MPDRSICSAIRTVPTDLDLTDLSDSFSSLDVTTPGRCPWCGTDPLYVAYHDREWGVPVRDGRALWEKLVLDGFQAGLAWITILRKREAFIAAFDGFDPERVARYGEADRARLLADAGIVRSPTKIDAAIRGARLFLEMGEEPFARLCWSVVGDGPLQNAWPDVSQVPAQTPASADLSKALKARGFTFVGPVIVYAFMQATGLVNDHLTTCFRHAEVAAMADA